MKSTHTGLVVGLEGKMCHQIVILNFGHFEKKCFEFKKFWIKKDLVFSKFGN